MKRHPKLIPLSQEHHHTLSLCARILREPAKNHAAEIDKHYIELSVHFEHEETLFAPYWTALNREDLRGRFENEHNQLRTMYRHAEYDNAEWNTAFATLLRDHARFEERELFPAIETLLPQPT